MTDVKTAVEVDRQILVNVLLVHLSDLLQLENAMAKQKQIPVRVVS